MWGSCLANVDLALPSETTPWVDMGPSPHDVAGEPTLQPVPTPSGRGSIRSWVRIPGQRIPLHEIGHAIAAACAVQHFSPLTARTYTHWARRFVVANGKAHPSDLGAPEITAFLSHLALDQKVSASTQNQALHALLFLYRVVLVQPIPPLAIKAVRAKQPIRVPVVLSVTEVQSFFRHLTGAPRLIALLQYGAGLRLMESLRLRVKDLDFDRAMVVVRGGKGDKDRIVPLPAIAVDPLRNHLRDRWRLHQKDLADGCR